MALTRDDCVHSTDKYTPWRTKYEREGEKGREGDAKQIVRVVFPLSFVYGFRSLLKGIERQPKKRN